MINYIVVIFISIFVSNLGGFDLKLKSDPFPDEAKKLLKNNNVDFHFDNYGNLRVIFSDQKNIAVLEKNNYIKELKSIIQQKWKKRGVYIHIPLEVNQPQKILKELGFDVYGFDPEKRNVLYLLKNGRGIPNIDNTFSAATIFIVRKNPHTNEKELLVINEYDKGDLTVVGGCGDNAELLTETAVRECEEEVGIKLKENDLRLMKITNVKIKSQDKNFVDLLFYTEVDFDTKVTIDQKEVMNYRWVPVKEVIKDDFMFDGKHFSPAYKKVILDDAKPNSFEKTGDSKSVFSISNFNS